MLPLGQVASVRVTMGPPSINTRTRSLWSTSMSTFRAATSGGYVAEASRQVAAQVVMPPGYHIEWSGQFEYLQRAEAKLKLVVPATLVVIMVLLFLNFGRLTETFIVMLSVPFALVGGAWLMWALGYNMSVAVAVGFIALAGVAAETGGRDADLSRSRARRDTTAETGRGRCIDARDLRRAIMTGAVERVRPKMMTVVAIMAGWCRSSGATGTGSEIMRRIAVPMVGGMVSSTVLTLLVIPAIYTIVKGWRLLGRTPCRSASAGGGHRWRNECPG